MKKVLTILIMIFFTIPLSAQEKMRIAIMDFEAKDIPKADALKISELIRNDMINSGSFTVVERAQMDKILNEQGFQQTGCTDISCAVEIGKILSTKKILVGTVMQLGDNIVITGRVVDVEKGTAEFSEKQSAANKNEVFSAVTLFVGNLTGRINENRKKTVLQDSKGTGTASVKMDKNIYGILSLTGVGITALSFGGAYYFDTKVKSANDEYNSLIPSYVNAADSATAVSLHNKMVNKKDEADKYAQYRNISYGIGGAMALLSGYFIYKYYTYPVSAERIQAGNQPLVFPVFSSNFSASKYSSNFSEFSFTGGVLIRF